MKGWMVFAGLLVGLTGASPAPACKFCCTSSPPTLRQEAAGATLILYGTVANPRQGRDGNGNATPEGVEGTTDFFIEQSIKTAPALGNRKRIEIQRYVPADPQKTKYLIFFDVHKGQLDPYKGLLVTPAAADYLRGMLAIDSKDTGKILAYAFRHLEHADSEIAQDAFREFQAVEYRDYRDFARTLRPDLLARWVDDPKAPVVRRGLYALLLGHCGREQDAVLLRKILNGAIKEESAGTALEQMLVGYTLLDPREGWKLIQGVVGDESVVFVSRYEGLRAIRFLWEYRPEVIARKELLAAACLLMQQRDMADLVMEDLRRWQQWQMTDQVLALAARKEFQDIPIIRRSMVRFALSSPEVSARNYVEQLRVRDPELVQDQEELLRLEKDATADTRAR